MKKNCNHQAAPANFDILKTMENWKEQVLKYVNEFDEKPMFLYELYKSFGVIFFEPENSFAYPAEIWKALKQLESEGIISLQSAVNTREVGKSLGIAIFIK